MLFTRSLEIHKPAALIFDLRFIILLLYLTINNCNLNYKKKHERST